MDMYILNVTMVIATMWIVERFWRIYYEKKKNSFWAVMIWIAFGLYQLFFHLRHRNTNIWMTICNIFLIWLISVSSYHCNGKRKYFLLVAFSVVWALIEFLVYFTLAVIPNPTETLDIMGEVISKILMMGFVYVVSSYWKRQKREFVPNNFLLYLMAFPIGSIYISFCMFYAQNYIFFSIVTYSILLVLNVIIFELYIKMNDIFMNECDKAVYAQQIDIISENTAHQKKIMEEFYREKHDLTNELVSLKGCIENGDLDNLMSNLDNIIHNYESMEKISDSGNNTVDAIINFKYATAKQYGIKFSLKIFIPNEIPIDICDIGVVLGNAIDNAIEAVKECRDSEKVIKISMGVRKEAWVVVIKNPCEHRVVKDRTGQLISTKQEKHRHGYGLKSIARIADKYQGEAITEFKNGIFSLVIVLNFREF